MLLPSRGKNGANLYGNFKKQLAIGATPKAATGLSEAREAAVAIAVLATSTNVRSFKRWRKARPTAKRAGTE